MFDQRPTREEELARFAKLYVELTQERKRAQKEVDQASGRREELTRKMEKVAQDIAKYVGPNQPTKYVMVDDEILIVDHQNGISMGALTKA